MVVERAYLTLITEDEGDVTFSTIPLTGTFSYLSLAEFGMSIANTDVIKNLPILSWVPEFNKNAENQLNNNYEFDTQVVIPPLLEYVCTLRLPAVTTVPAGTKIRLTIEGAGAIIAPRTTF
jgi:hypothetical protein